LNCTVAQTKIDGKNEEVHSFATNLEEGQHDYENGAVNNSAAIISRLLCSLHQGVTDDRKASPQERVPELLTRLVTVAQAE